MSQPRRRPKLFSELIPDDVVFDILTRFPVKSLIRFRCVSKSYNNTITSPIFITKHLNLNKSNNNHNAYLLYSLPPISGREFCAVVCNNNRTLTGFQIPFVHASMEGFGNGLFCLFNRADFTLYLWNPCIKKFKIIATPRSSLKIKGHVIHHGFAYHSQNNDFKILKIIIYYYPRLLHGTRVLPPPPDASVYTLSTDSWRRVVIHEESLTRSVDSLCQRPFLFFNGALHSVACLPDNNFILCFDVNDERFREIMIPRNYLDGFSPQTLGQLVVFKGSLALVYFGKDLNEESDICCIWVMREYGVVESWTRSTVPLNNVERFFGSTDTDELLIETQDGQLVSFDPDSLNANSLEIQSPGWLFSTTDFMESLVLVDGENQD